MNSAYLPRPWLAADELQELCGYKLKHKQREALDMMGITYHLRPDGKLIVLRSELGDSTTQTAASNDAQPDMSAI